MKTLFNHPPGNGELNYIAQNGFKLPNHVALPSYVANMAYELRKTKKEEGLGLGKGPKNKVARQSGQSRMSLFGD